MKKIKLNELEKIGLLTNKIALDIIIKDLENNKVDMKDIEIMDDLAETFMNIYNNHRGDE